MLGTTETSNRGHDNEARGECLSKKLDLVRGKKAGYKPETMSSTKKPLGFESFETCAEIIVISLIEKDVISFNRK